MKLKILLVVNTILILILEALPFGAVLNFAAAPGEPHLRETFSYFSLTPFGYANFGPFLTAMLSCVLFIVSGLYLIQKSRHLAKLVFISASLAFAMSMMPLFGGFDHFSLVGVLITGLLAGQIWLMLKIAKEQ